jgi:hypothetical protein
MAAALDHAVLCCAALCLQNGTDDKTFRGLFEPIMGKVMEVFRPGAIVMQCGEQTAALGSRGFSASSLQGVWWGEFATCRHCQLHTLHAQVTVIIVLSVWHMAALPCLPDLRSICATDSMSHTRMCSCCIAAAAACIRC